MPLFLNARHWQIATMQLIPIVCLYFLRDVFSPLQLGCMWLLLVGVTVAWLYSIGVAANRKLEASLQRNPQLFGAAAIVSVLVFLVVLVLMYRSVETQTPPPGWLIHLLFAGLASFFYTLWYAASQFVAAEKQRQIIYIEYAFPMLGFWFGFVGAWFLQPRVNHLLGKQSG